MYTTKKEKVGTIYTTINFTVVYLKSTPKGKNRKVKIPTHIFSAHPNKNNNHPARIWLVNHRVLFPIFRIKFHRVGRIARLRVGVKKVGHVESVSLLFRGLWSVVIVIGFSGIVWRVFRPTGRFKTEAAAVPISSPILVS